MDAAEYKHVVLGLIFLKYISDAFEERYAELDAQRAQGVDPEDRDEYRAEGIFWVPPAARWSGLAAGAKQPAIGTLVDGAMEALERENPTLRDVLPKGYARPTLDKTRLGELIDLFANLDVGGAGEAVARRAGAGVRVFSGRVRERGREAGGRVLHAAAGGAAAGRDAGAVPGAGVRPVLRVGGDVRPVREVRGGAERGARRHLGVWAGVDPTTWRLAKMNLAIRRIEANLGAHHGDTFHQDLHPDLRADYILANPPFNISDWGGERLKGDRRWQYGTPPAGNANYAWIQHIAFHLTPNGVAGFVLANGSLSSNSGGEGEIRRRLVEADLVDCIVALPGQLFYSTQIPVSLWFLARNKRSGRGRDGATLQDRSGHILFIDARKLGRLEDRVHRTLDPADIGRIAGAYHAWRGDGDGGAHEDVPGFAKAATLAEVAGHGHVLTPGRYVGVAEAEADAEPFGEKMARLTATLEEQFAESARLEGAIRDNLAALGLTPADAL